MLSSGLRKAMKALKDFAAEIGGLSRLERISRRVHGRGEDRPEGAQWPPRVAQGREPKKVVRFSSHRWP